MVFLRFFERMVVLFAMAMELARDQTGLDTQDGCCIVMTTTMMMDEDVLVSPNHDGNDRRI